MKKKFTPFKSFDRACGIKGKTLHDTMQDSPNEKFERDEDCKGSGSGCVPYWQETGNIRCGTNNIVEAEENDGCGNTRWFRKEVANWVETGETGCDEKQNRTLIEEINQCGDTRMVSTMDKCCDPVWVRVPDSEPNCDQVVLRVLEEDGCGNTRWTNTSEAVSWIQTGEARCLPGDVYEVEQINQCGHIRWQQLSGGCPCIPDWQTTGPQRCTGDYVENQEADGCGNTRWSPTSTPVNWADTGETRCRNGFTQNEQMSQCGTTRWFTTDITCTNSPPANELEPKYVSDLLSAAHFKFMSCRLNASDGLIYWGQGDEDGFDDGIELNEPWVTGSFDRGHYEARISYTADGPPDGTTKTRSGSNLDEWFDLGNTSQITHSMTCNQVNPVTILWTNIIIRIDIRKKGESISGGCTFGPFNLRAT